MTVMVRLFASLRELAGTEACRLVLRPGARGNDAKTAVVARYPELRGLVDSTRLALNREYQPWDSVLRDGDELVLIPPVSGG